MLRTRYFRYVSPKLIRWVGGVRCLGLFPKKNCSVCDPLRMLQVGAGRRKCKEASEIHKFSTWQQVLQRGNPFCVKGGLREQRQSKFCSKRHHGHVKKSSPGGSGYSRPSATAQVFLNFNEREYNHTLLSPPFSRPNLPKREQEQKDPPPPTSPSI